MGGINDAVIVETNDSKTEKINKYIFSHPEGLNYHISWKLNSLSLNVVEWQQQNKDQLYIFRMEYYLAIEKN